MLTLFEQLVQRLIVSVCIFLGASYKVPCNYYKNIVSLSYGKLIGPMLKIKYFFCSNYGYSQLLLLLEYQYGKLDLVLLFVWLMRLVIILYNLWFYFVCCYG